MLTPFVAGLVFANCMTAVVALPYAAFIGALQIQAGP
jgi:hypothetical protein